MLISKDFMTLIKGLVPGLKTKSHVSIDKFRSIIDKIPVQIGIAPDYELSNEYQNNYTVNANLYLFCKNPVATFDIGTRKFRFVHQEMIITFDALIENISIHLMRYGFKKALFNYDDIKFQLNQLFITKNNFLIIDYREKDFGQNKRYNKWVAGHSFEIDKYNPPFFVLDKKYGIGIEHKIINNTITIPKPKSDDDEHKKNLELPF